MNYKYTTFFLVLPQNRGNSSNYKQIFHAVEIYIFIFVRKLQVRFGQKSPNYYLLLDSFRRAGSATLVEIRKIFA